VQSEELLQVLPLLVEAIAAGPSSLPLDRGGGFLMTPALVILRLPKDLAVRTSLAWLTGNAFIGVPRHRLYDNTRIRLGLTMASNSVFGVEAGVRALNRAVGIGLLDEVVQGASVAVAAAVSNYTLREASGATTRLAKSEDGTMERDEASGLTRAIALLVTLLGAGHSRTQPTAGKPHTRMGPMAHR
jgi:uncharacterized membrane protein YfcA